MVLANCLAMVWVLNFHTNKTLYNATHSATVYSNLIDFAIFSDMDWSACLGSIAMV